MTKVDKSKPKKESTHQELQDQLKRALADYQNLERRVEEERRLVGQLSSAVLVEKFLPVLDNLEKAQTHLKDEGLEMVIRQFKDILESEGIEEINAEGAQFDPNLHEAVEVAEGPDEGRVVKVQVKGYKMNDKVLRVAKVVVSSKEVDQDLEEKAEKAKEFGDYA